MDRAPKPIDNNEPQMRVRQGIIDKLRSVELGNEWGEVKDLPDEFTGEPWKCSGWGRIIDGRKVVVLMSREGKHHAKWRLFVDDEFVKEFSDIVLQMGSGKDAMEHAEEAVSGK